VKKFLDERAGIAISSIYLSNLCFLSPSPLRDHPLTHTVMMIEQRQEDDGVQQASAPKGQLRQAPLSEKKLIKARRWLGPA
jgi:hypothetical protein